MSKISLNDEDRGTETSKSAGNPTNNANNNTDPRPLPPKTSTNNTSGGSGNVVGGGGGSKILRENSLVEPVVKNPFVHELVLTKYDKIKVYKM